MEDVGEFVLLCFGGEVWERRWGVLGGWAGDGVVERDGIVAQRAREEEGSEELLFGHGWRPLDAEVVEHDEFGTTAVQTAVL